MFTEAFMYMYDLWGVGIGLSARIKTHDNSPENAAMLRRLMDIGFTEGAEIECVLAAPGGGIKAYLVRGSVIALREGDARLIKTGEAYAK